MTPAARDTPDGTAGGSTPPRGPGVTHPMPACQHDADEPADDQPDDAPDAERLASRIAADTYHHSPGRLHDFADPAGRRGPFQGVIDATANTLERLLEPEVDAA